MQIEHDGEYALVASAGGAPRHPVWYWNLTVHPDQVLIQDRPKPFRCQFARSMAASERNVGTAPSMCSRHTRGTRRPLSA